MLKVLVDESTGQRVAEALRQDGFDVVTVREVMIGAKDRTILAYAAEQRRLLITNDKDFGELIRRHRLPHAGVILLRLELDTPTQRIAYLRVALRIFGAKLEDRFVVIREGAIRLT